MEIHPGKLGERNVGALSCSRRTISEESGHYRGDDQTAAWTRHGVTTRASADRQRLLRTLTFWLRPAFVLRTLTGFQRVAGFDRAIALASSALTALIPLAVVVGAVLPHADAQTAANAIIARYGLAGGGAAAVRNALEPAAHSRTAAPSPR